MEYIYFLRSKVGTAPLLLPGAAVAILDGEDRILLQKRTDTGHWGLPGGLMEPGESAEETARREVWEKTGLQIPRGARGADFRLRASCPPIDVKAVRYVSYGPNQRPNEKLGGR